MFERSPSATSVPASTLASLGIGALSPVSAASWASSVAARRIRPSAGTRSPASTWTRSPGTTSTAGTSATVPSRTTLACGTCRSDSASMLARALSSWREPSTTLRRISSATITPVETSPMTKLTAVTATSMMFIGSRSCCAATAHTDGGFSPLDRVRAVAREPLGRLAGGQARCRVGPESRDDVGAVLGVRRRSRRVISPGERVVRGHVRRRRLSRGRLAVNPAEEVRLAAEIVPRWEWRTFGNDFGAAEEALGAPRGRARRGERRPVPALPGRATRR